MRASGFRFGLFALLVAAQVAHAEDLPVNVQVQLLSKMVSSIPNMQPAGTDPIKIVVVHPADGVSRGAQSLANTIRQLGKFGTYDTNVELMSAAQAANIAAAKPQLVYVAPEVDEKGVTGLVDAIGSAGTVTVSTVSDHPKLGVVLGFSLVEARPRVLVNLKQARKQNIDFKNKFLTFAVIVDK